MIVENPDKPPVRLSELNELPGVTYPEAGKGPISLKYDEIVEKYPWAEAVKGELVALYREQRRLSGNYGEDMDMKDMPEGDAREYRILIARSEGIISAVNLLGLGAINSEAKNEIPQSAIPNYIRVLDRDRS